ncbi:MAG: 4a-hydroxytetrahydrobiopterin dehydratase [Nitrososphaerales archaeon]
MTRLSNDEIEERIKQLNGWVVENNGIKKEFRFKDFVETVNFLNKIVPIAEEMEHHPDVTIKDYNRMIVSVTTHDEGGITELDFGLAQKIDGLER